MTMRAHPLVGLDEHYADLLAALDRGEALRRALALLAEGSEVAWTAGPDADGVLTLDQVTGDWTGVLRALQVPPNTGLTGKVFQTGRAEWVDDYFGSQEITHDFDRHMASEKVRRVLAVPLLHDGNGDNGHEFGTTGVPENYLLEPSGRLAWGVAGPVDAKMLEEHVAPLLPPEKKKS